MRDSIEFVEVSTALPKARGITETPSGAERSAKSTHFLIDREDIQKRAGHLISDPNHGGIGIIQIFRQR
jgi:hypothetical protein